MLIAYLTTDEVNRHVAEQMAHECGVALRPLLLNEPSPGEEFDAVVYDWDYLPAQRQQAILAEMVAGQVLRPVAVHSYNLEEACVEALRRQDVAVYRALQPELFRLLALAAIYFRAANTSVGDRENKQEFEERLLRRLREFGLGRQGLTDPLTA